MGQLGPCRRGALHQLGEIEAAEAPLGLSDPVELGFELLEPVGLDLQRGEKARERACRLAQLELGAAQFLSAGRQLRRQPLERSQGALGESDQSRGSVALLGRQRLERRLRRLCQLGHVTDALALAAQSLLAALV